MKKMLSFSYVAFVSGQKLPLEVFKFVVYYLSSVYVSCWLYLSGNGGSTSGYTRVVSTAPDVS